MRILFVSSDLGTFRGDTYQQFKDNGHDVQFYTVKQPFTLKRKINAMINLQRKLRHVDIIFFDYLSGLAEYVSKFALKNVPMVARCHRFEVYEYTETDRNRKRLVSTAQRMKKIVCVSEAIEKRLKNICPTSETVVIYNGVDIKKFTPKTEFFSTPLKIGSLGFLQPRKGFKTLIQTVHELVTEGFNLRLHIAGKGKQKRELEHTIKERKAEKYIFLDGYIKEEDKPAWYRSLDVYVQNSTNEGHCIGILEAMASGLPVLSTDVGGAKETLPSSAMYRPENPLELREALLRCINLSEAEVKQISQMNRKKVIDCFDLKKQSRSMLKILEDNL